MTRMNEQVFFQQIANRLGRSQPLTQAPARDVMGVPAFWEGYDLPLSLRIAKFAEEVGKLGGSVILCDDVLQLSVRLAELLRELAPRGVGVWGGEFVNEWALAEVLELYPCVLWDPESGEPDRTTALQAAFAKVDVGITGCDYAIADTGTVVLACDAVRGRSVSLLPSVHIVLVRREQVRTRMGEVLAELLTPRQGAGAQPSSVNFISGPSRSSDIENDLSIGVHGPAAVIVMVAS